MVAARLGRRDQWGKERPFVLGQIAGVDVCCHARDNLRTLWEILVRVGSGIRWWFLLALALLEHLLFLLPRRWVIERGFAWATRFRHLARDYERLPEVLAGLHLVAFACLMFHRLISVLLVHTSL